MIKNVLQQMKDKIQGKPKPRSTGYLLHKQDGKNYNLYDLPDGFVLKGDVDLHYQELEKLPDLSKVTVEGDFHCSYNKLTSLEGSPQIMPGNFYCSRNQLKTLVGGPRKVGGNFHCFLNHLTSLEGSPQEVGGHFWCYNNALTTLEGAPQKVGRAFNCVENLLESLLFISEMDYESKVYCDQTLGTKYGFSDSSLINEQNGGIYYGSLICCTPYKSELAAYNIRLKDAQIRKEREAGKKKVLSWYNDYKSGAQTKDTGRE